MSDEKYTIIRDTREKPGQGWMFFANEYCEGTVVETLESADYSIKGLEKILAIERKGSVSEFCLNLNEARFVAPADESKSLRRQSEIVRLEAIPYSFIILEFTVEDLLKYPNLPEIPAYLRKRIKFGGYAALRKVIELQLQYKTKILFCGTKGKDVAASIIKRVVERVRKNGKAEE